jgi:stress-induced-phosphoprotein 1
VAKALGRIGSAYAKKDDLPNAIKFYQKSLTEHRTPDVLTKLRDAERAKAESDRRAYIDPTKAAEAREEGNKLFKSGDFVGAVKLYSECVKRDPEDPKGWTNRAAAYQKLAALPEALKDAEKAIEVDPKYGECLVSFPASHEYLNVLLVCSQGLYSQVSHPLRYAGVQQVS